MRLRALGGAAVLLSLGSAVGVAAPSGASSPAAAPAARLLVTATEFRFALSRATLPAGSALVQLSNRGEDPHDLVLRRVRAASGGRGVETAPGATSERSVRLRPGRYVLFCSLPGHRTKGMQARLSVRGGR